MAQLKETEKNAVELYIAGVTKMADIARQLFVTTATAEGYFNRAKKKLNCHSNHALKSAYEVYKNEIHKL